MEHPADIRDAVDLPVARWLVYDKASENIDCRYFSMRLSTLQPSGGWLKAEAV